MTDANLFAQGIVERFNTVSDEILQYVESKCSVMPSEYEIVLELRKSNNIGYYFVDHTTELLFWFDDFNVFDFGGELKIVLPDALLGRFPFSSFYHLLKINLPTAHEIHSQYWFAGASPTFSHINIQG